MAIFTRMVTLGALTLDEAMEMKHLLEKGLPREFVLTESI